MHVDIFSATALILLTAENNHFCLLHCCEILYKLLKRRLFCYLTQYVKKGFNKFLDKIQKYT